MRTRLHLRRVAERVWLGCLLLCLFPPCAAQTPESNLMVRALDAYRRGDCDTAIPVLQQLLDRQPRNIASRKLLAQCLLQQHKWDEARTQFEHVMRDSPRDFDAAAGAKAALAQLQQVEQRSQSRVIETRAASVEQLRLKHELDQAAQLVRSDRKAEAEQFLLALIGKHPGSVLPRLRLAELYSSMRRFADAADLYRALATTAQAPPLFLHRAAQNYEWGSNYADSLRYYRSYLRRVPGDATARMSLADVLVHERLFHDAVPELQLVLKSNAGQVRAQVLLAQCYEQMGEAELALAAYEQVLRLEPGDAASRNARDRYRRYFDEMPLRLGFAAVERGDRHAAIREFSRYLAAHPDDAQTTLRMARLYSAEQDFSSARAYYDRYQEQRPDDLDVIRERANMAMWARDYRAAIAELQKLTETGKGKISDYETTIQAYTWNGDANGARPYAEQLLRIQPQNPVAQATLRELEERAKFESRQQADRLASDHRFPQAIEAYRAYMSRYGADDTTQVLICRLYSWNRDFLSATGCYREYLLAHTDDQATRLELAEVDSWSGRYADAELQYRKLLRGDARNPAVLLGLAQSLQYRNEDPITVSRAFRDVLMVDPNNPLALNKVRELRAVVAPQLQVSHTSFSDSDGLYWALERVSFSWTEPGRVRISPYYTSGYFRQQRVVPGTSPAILALNREIQQEGNAILGNGGGVRVEVTPNVHWSIDGEVGMLAFDTGRANVNAQWQVNYRPGSERSYGITYIRREAIFDTWTIAPLAAGMTGDSVLLSTQQNLGAKLRLGVQGGVTRVSRDADSQFDSNTQRRLWAQLDYPVQRWLRLGYVFRLSSFTAASPLYFSPSLYQTHGLSYAINQPISERLRFTVAGEFSYSRVDQKDAFEMGTSPGLNWKLGRGFGLEVGYRFSLGHTSAFGVPTYRTQGGQVQLRKTF